MTDVYITHFEKTTLNDTCRILKSLDAKDRLSCAKTILIKVNLAAGQLMGPETAAVINPDVLRHFIDALTALNPAAKILIAESDSIGRGFASAKFVFQNYEKMFAGYENVALYDLSHSKVAVYPTAGIFFPEGIILSSIFNEADVFISFSKMKTHTNTVMTGCLKNLFGCLPEMEKDKFHPYLPKVIADIATAIRPNFSILEACPAMEGQGPIFGTTKDLGLVLFAADPVAIDATAARIMGFEPSRIPMLTEAQKAGVGTIDEKQIVVKGEDLTSVAQPFQFISTEQKLYVRLGFFVQRIADKLHNLGHLIHLVSGTFWAIGKLANKFRKRIFGKHG